MVAAGFLAVWLAVVLTLSPQRLLTFLAFFAPLFGALAAIGAVVAYAVEWQRGYYPSLRECLRRGVLGAGVVVLNLALVAAHRWKLPVAGGSVAAAILLDIVLAWRRR